jgi:hypothetical protein
MPNRTRIPALDSSSALAFPFGVTTDGDGLRLHSARGAVRLRLSRPNGAPGPVLRGDVAAWIHGLQEVEIGLDPIDPLGFVEDIASWLDAYPVGQASEFGAVRLSAVRLGSGAEASGAPWIAYKLFFDGEGDHELHAEVFLRLAPDGTQAQLLEKWAAYREKLPAALESVLGLSVRRWQEGEPIALREGEEQVWFHRAVGFASPLGWVRSDQAGGSVKWVDPTDEYGFEVSLLEVPPMPAITLLALMLSTDPKAAGAQGPSTLPHSRYELATAEHAWMDPDPHRGGEDREARCRWLVARGLGRVVFLTFVYWTDDAPAALPCWERALGTLRLRRGSGGLAMDGAVVGAPD